MRSSTSGICSTACSGGGWARFSSRTREREADVVPRTGRAQHYQLEKRTTADGTTTWGLTTRLPLRDRSDNVVGIIVISRNVTEQKRAEEKAQEAVQRRDQFLAMLSHELRNPLGAIVSATALLER